MSVDVFLFNAINGLAGRWQWLDNLAIFFACGASSKSELLNPIV